MDCCKKEDCCPCDKLKERIDCLQAQIDQLTVTKAEKLELVGILKFLAKAGVINQEDH